MNIRSSLFATLALTAVVACFAPAALAQPAHGSIRASRLYNPATETTVKGTVEEVRTIPARRGTGTHLYLKSESDTYDVHIGPTKFIAEKNFTFAKGDQIVVTGSKVKYDSHEAIIAREVRMNGKILTLRNVHGFPEWSGARRQQ